MLGISLRMARASSPKAIMEKLAAAGEIRVRWPGDWNCPEDVALPIA
jgi:hypothetical protein